MRTIIGALAFAALTASAFAGALDQTIATWTITPKPGIRFESSLAVHLGVIESKKVEFCKFCDPKGVPNLMRVDVTRVKRFFVNTDYQADTENIGIVTEKDRDVLWLVEGMGPSAVDATGKGLAGFARFSLKQKAERDAAYKALCDLIHQAP
jgi:hypothetical protein